MIVVFVVDTSPSMGLPLVPKPEGVSSASSGGGGAAGGMSRLDLAKMFVEDMSRKLVRQHQAHIRVLQQQQTQQQQQTGATTNKQQQLNDQQRSWRNLGLLGSGGGSNNSTGSPSLLLLSTSRHSPETALCAVGGRLLVGFGSSASVSGGGADENAANANSPTSTTSAAGAASSPPGGNNNNNSSSNGEEAAQHHQQQMESFQKSLKSLKSYPWTPNSNTNFPEQAGGAMGLNAALSAGLQLLSRYRLQSRWTENFGLGRLPAASVLVPSNTGSAASGGGGSGVGVGSNANVTTTSMTTVNGLQPACLVLLTDGACLSQPPNLGGGSLQLQFGKSTPLKEFYSEPFRWDQRVYCLNIASGPLPSALRALCECTGGSFWNLQKNSQLSHVTDQLLQRLMPPLPARLPLVDPLYLRLPPLPLVPPTTSGTPINPPKTPPGYPPGTLTLAPAEGAFFCHGGPVVSIQALEPDVDPISGVAAPPKLYRAMLLYTGSTATTMYFGNATAAPDALLANAASPNGAVSPPLWCIPEAYFANKKLDTLPPRKAQPLLFYSKYPPNLGSRSFEPTQVIKMLHRLDQACLAIRNIQAKAGGNPASAMSNTNSRFLHRDVYICEWLVLEGGRPAQVNLRQPSPEYFPVFVQGGGRPTLTEDSDNYLHIGILHIPSIGSASLAANANPSRLATLTLLPPEPHILLPLLLRAVETEHRLLKKMEAAGTLKGKAKVNVPLDEAWRSEFRAYLFRVPTYYHISLRWALRSLLPATVLPPGESLESIMKQCFSTVCLQKIRNGEQLARDNNERLERQEASLRPVKPRDLNPTNNPNIRPLRYGQYDPRGTLESYLSALRNMPAPWKFQATQNMHRENVEVVEKNPSSLQPPETPEASGDRSPRSVLDIIGDLPKDGLLAYYDSRRRWLFGGTGLTTRGIHVEGVNYDGSNSQRCNNFPKHREESALTLAGVGASTVNETTVAKMGDYRERLLFSKAPIVGYGSNDCAGVAATTAVDGSPRWSVDDDAMPMTFFDPVTGDFTDNVHTRVRARLMVNFGNPYREKRADSLIPEKYLKDAPSSSAHPHGSDDRNPPGSPPHDSFDSVEEDEAVFVRKSPSRTSPRREEIEIDDSAPTPPPLKKQRTDSMDSIESTGSSSGASDVQLPPPPPKPSAPPLPPSQKRPPAPPKIGSSVPPPPPPKPPTKPLPKGAPQQRRPSVPGAAPPPPKAVGKVPPPPPPSVRPPPPGQRRPPPPKPTAAAPAPPPPKALLVKQVSKGEVPPAPAGSLKRKTSETSASLAPAAAPAAGATPATVQRKPSGTPSNMAAAAASVAAGTPSATVQRKPSGTPANMAAAAATASASMQRKPSGTSASMAAAAAAAASSTTSSSTPLASASPTAEDLQRPDVKPTVKLPTGWICVWSRSQARWYFFNQRTNQSVWQWPPPGL